MPAINVARTDTFEIQRQKINQIGDQIFSISQGGSDLSTGNLKLGDGTKVLPSLSFTNDANLGLYRSGTNSIGYVAAEKRLLDITADKVVFYKNSTFEKNELETNGLVITSGGANYEAGNYSDISLTGGSGVGATATIDVEAFDGSITTQGLGYTPGSFSNIFAQGGTGSDATISFEVDGIGNGDIVGGSGYTDGFYTDVPLTGGSGNGARADISASTGEIQSVGITAEGSGYVNGDVLSVSNGDVGGTGSGFTYTITSQPGVVRDLTFGSKGTGYVVGDVLTLPVAQTGISVNLPGEITLATTLSTASAQITVSSTTGLSIGMQVSQDPGDTGSVDPTATIQSIDSATQLTLTANPLSDGAANLTFSTGNLNSITVPDSSVFSIGDILTVTSGTGQLAANTAVTIIQDATTIGIDNQPTFPGAAVISSSPAFGVGTQALAYTINSVGVVTTVNVTDGGNGYAIGDTLSANASDLVQSVSYNVNAQGLEKITFSPSVSAGTFSVGQDVILSGGISSVPIYAIGLNGGNIDYMLIGSLGLVSGDVIERDGNPAVNGTVDTAESKNKYFIDLGSGDVLHPNLTLYSGDTYVFNYAAGHPLYFSRSRDGKWDPGNVTGVSGTVTAGSKTVTVSSTTGILVGMAVSENGINVGDIQTNTTVESIVDATTITLSENAATSGAIVLDFTGAPYVDGVTRDDGQNRVTIKVSDTTPSTLYYYCDSHPDMAGEDGAEATITVSTNNPRVFGSGLSISATSITTTEQINLNVDTGTGSYKVLDVDTGTIDTLGTQILTADIRVDTPKVNVSTIASTTAISINTSSANFTGNVDIGSANITADGSTGDLTSVGTIRANTKLSSNNIGFVEGNEFYTTSGDFVIRPPSTNISRVDSTKAFVVPSGISNERPNFPQGSLTGDGAIRFNTETGQYEGYSSATTSWSSLGGVRDIDGNTYILAELTTGANDNTLWFYNDAINTLKLTNNFLDFRSVKTISSGKLGLPAFTEWTSNTPVTVGQYLKHKNNLYEVTGAGATATSGSEPTHTSGTQNNGTAQLTWSSSAVDPLTFDEVSELRVGPDKNCPLIIGQELKFDDNTISTQVQDLVIQPNAGKQVIVDSVTHLRIPAGNNNQKSIAPAGPGSIRFNTEIQQYEGYSGSNWSSLGGVRDVDGNTYIIPETAPAANENILYFYNDNANTLQLSTTTLDFTGIDTITTTHSNSLEITTEVFTLNSLDTTIDNSGSTRTFISTTKQYLDLGLSSGLNTDPVLRLDDQGDVYLNTTFGSGTFNGVKIFDGDLKEFELADYKIKSSTFVLDKGGLESSNVVLYPSATSKGCKVTVISKSSSGKRSMTEYSVIDNGTDIYHNEYASLNTSEDQYTAAFDFTASNEARITLTLTNDHNVADIINFTVLVQEIK